VATSKRRKTMSNTLKVYLALALILLAGNVTLAKGKKSNGPIRYVFPVQVDSLINKYLNSVVIEPKSKKDRFPFFIILSSTRDTSYLLICERKNADSILNSLVDKSNRITKKKGIPIVLDEDIDFSSDLNTFEWPEDGSPITRHTVWISGQSIKFYMVRYQATIMKYEYYYP
jgi:hypothetical protein